MCKFILVATGTSCQDLYSQYHSQVGCAFKINWFWNGAIDLASMSFALEDIYMLLR